MAVGTCVALLHGKLGTKLNFQSSPSLLFTQRMGGLGLTLQQVRDHLSGQRTKHGVVRLTVCWLPRAASMDWCDWLSELAARGSAL